MKRLCIYYDSVKTGKKASDFIGKKIEFIICKECQKKLIKFWKEEENGN